MKLAKEKTSIFNFLITILTLSYLVSYLDFPHLSVIRYVICFIIQIVFFLFVKNKKILLNKKELKYIVFLMISMFLSLISSDYVCESLFKIFSLIDCIFFSVVVLPFFFKNADRKKVLTIIRNNIVFFLIIAYLLFRNDYSISGDLTRIGKLIRLEMGFTHSNILAIFCFICCILSIYLIIINKNKKWDFISLFFSIFLIYQSGSRTALYALLIFSVVYFFNLAIKNKKTKITIIFYLIIVCILGLLMFSYSNNQISMVQIDRLLSYRITYMKNAISVLIDNNSLYIGMGAFRNSMLKEVGGTLLDNSYINYLYQFGLISTFVFTTWLIYNYKKIINAERNSINSNNFELNIYIKFTKSLYLTFLIYSMLENIILNISSYFAVLMYFFISIIGDRDKNDNSNSTSL